MSNNHGIATQGSETPVSLGGTGLGGVNILFSGIKWLELQAHSMEVGEMNSWSKLEIIYIAS